MAAGAAQGLDIGPAAEFAALLLGGGLATASHAAKAGSRVAINTSPEPFSNFGASVAEDVSVVAGLWTALNHPWLFIGLLLVFLLLALWLLPKLWRMIRRTGVGMRRWFGQPGDDPPPAASSVGSAPPPAQAGNDRGPA